MYLQCILLMDCIVAIGGLHLDFKYSVYAVHTAAGGLNLDFKCSVPAVYTAGGLHQDFKCSVHAVDTTAGGLQSDCRWTASGLQVQCTCSAHCWWTAKRLQVDYIKTLSAVYMQCTLQHVECKVTAR